jgi:F0F1-type ATP synthase assembly protein I
MERNSIVTKRKAEEVAMENAKAKRKKEIEEAITLVLMIVAGVLLLALVAWGTAQYVDFMRR